MESAAGLRFDKKCQTDSFGTTGNRAWYLTYYIPDRDDDTQLHILIAGLPEWKDFIKLLIKSTWPASLLRLKNKDGVSLSTMASMLKLSGSYWLPVPYDKWGYTPLHHACKNGNVDVVMALTKAFDADEIARMQSKDLLLPDMCSSIDARNNAGETPLHLAVEHGHLEVVKLLLNLEADAHSMRYIDGSRPLVIAVDKSHRSIVEFLLKYYEDNQHTDMQCLYGLAGLLEPLKKMGLAKTFADTLNITVDSSFLNNLLDKE